MQDYRFVLLLRYICLIAKTSPIKTKYEMKKELLIFIVICASIFAQAQQQFTNYGSKNTITSIAEKGNNVWIGTNSGLFVRSKSSGSIILTYSMENGLPSNTVNDVVVDAFDNVWVATSNGLAKFDGASWLIYNTSSGLPYNSIKEITIDQSGNIWVYTRNESNISKLENNVWTNYSTSSYPYCITAGPNGNIWIGTHEGAMFFDVNTETFTSYHDEIGTGTEQRSVYDIIVDANLNIWLGASNGLHKYDGNAFTSYTSSNGVALFAEHLATDASGNIWLSSYTVLKKFIISTESASNYYNNSTLTTITIDSNEKVWLGSEYGLKRFVNVDDTWDEFIVSNSLSNSNVSDFVFDTSDNLWVATEHGLSKLTGDNWSTWFVNEGNHENSNYFYCIDIDPTGGVWLGSHSGVSYFDGTSFTNYLSMDRGKDIVCNADGSVWIATDNGLVHFDGTTATTYTTADGLAGDNCLSLTKDNSGNLWIGTFSGGVSVWDGSNFTNYTTADGLQSNYIHDLYLDNTNKIWCLNNGGILVFDAGTWSAVDVNASGIPNSFYKSVVQSPDGKFWFASIEGIVKYDEPNTAIYTINDGLISNDVQKAGVSSNGVKWFATPSGLSKVVCESPILGFTNDFTCLPGATTLSDTSLQVDATSNYQWDINNDGSVEYTSQNILHTFTTEGTYSVKLTVDNDACTNTLVQDVTVYAVPMVITSPAGNINICSGSSTEIELQAMSIPVEIFNEDFNYSDISASGWTPSGEGINNWNIANSTNSGGDSPELKLNWSAQFYGEAYIVSPIINTNSYNALIINFSDYVDWYSNSITIGLKTTSNGTDWTTIWTDTIASQEALNNESITISNSDVGSASFQIALFLECNTSNDFDYFYFDNLTINGMGSGGVLSPNYSYLWSTTETNSSINASTDGDYGVTVTNGNCVYTPEIVNVNTIEPSIPNICMVSVDQETDKNLIVWEKPITDSIQYYYIYKEIATNNYQIIGSRNYNEVSEFVDYNSLPNVHADRYKISLVDICDNESSLSYFHQTMNLSQAQGAQSDEVVLIWNKYIDESGNYIPANYKVYRGLDVNNLDLETSLTGGLSTYNYNMQNVVDGEHFMVAVDMQECNPSVNHASGGPYYQSSSNLEDEGVISTSINFIANKDLEIYPNPMLDYTVIKSNKKIETIKLYNIAGELIRCLSNLNTNEYKLLRNELSKGTYILEINKSGHQKLIVE